MAFRSSRTETVVVVILALVFVVGVLLWLSYPVVPRSFLGWVLLFVIGIPTWFVLEWLGERVLGARIFARVGSAARIALGVPLLILFVIVGAFLIRLGQRAIAGA